jgi:hypothetical protein
MRLEIMGAALLPPHVRRLFRLTGFLWHAASFPLINALFGFFGAFARINRDAFDLPPRSGEGFFRGRSGAPRFRPPVNRPR